MAMNFVRANSEAIGFGDLTQFDMGTGDLTWMIWYRYSGTPTVSNTMIAKGQTDANNRVGILMRSGGSVGQVRAELEDNDNATKPEVQAEDPDRTDDGEWHHAVAVRDNSAGANGELRLYIDGVLKATDTIPAGVYDVDQAIELTIGCFHDGAGTRNRFYGENGGDELADARIYKGRALSVAEIETIYFSRGHDGIVQDLVARYMLNEFPEGGAVSGAGVVKDSGPDQLNGTPTNTPTGAGSALSLRKRAL